MFGGWMFGAWVYIALIVIAGIVAAFVVAARRARARGDASPVVGITRTVSALWAAACLIGAVVVVLVTLLQDDVRITVPVREFWPQLPDGTEIEGMTATRTGGGFTSAELVARDLSVGVRVCWALGQALGWLVPGAIAALIAVACFQLLSGRAFAPAVARMATITAVVVTVGGIAAQVLNDVAGSMASAELLRFSGGRYEEVAGIEDAFAAWWPEPGFGITFPFWPIAAGLAFAALAAVFRYGSRLQRDTEGLV